MSKKKRKTFEKLYQEWYDSGASSPEGFMAHILNVSWFRYLDTLPPKEVYELLQPLTGEISQGNQQLEGFDFDDFEYITLAEEDLKELAKAFDDDIDNHMITEYESPFMKEIRKDIADLQDKMNDITINEHLYKSVISKENKNKKNKDNKKDKGE